MTAYSTDLSRIGARPVERGTYGAGELGPAKRLADQIGALFEDTIAGDHIGGIAGHIKHLGRARLAAERIGNSVAGHALRQDHVGQQQIHACRPIERGNRRRAVSRFDDRVAEISEDIGGKCAHLGIVFDQEDRFTRLCPGRGVGAAALSRC